MEQGDEFGPAFETAQLCRSSGNSAQCINAIEDYAKAYSEGQVASINPRRVQFKTDQDTRYGYDPNVIDHAFIAGKSKPLDRDMTIRDPANSSQMITIELPKIRKQEEPSLHQNKSINYNQAFPIKNANSDLETEMEFQEEEDENKRRDEEELKRKRAENMEMTRRMMQMKMKKILESSPSSHLVNISDANKNTYAFLLFIGIFVPLVFILVIIVLENIPKK